MSAPYKIEKSDLLGRYLTAARDIKQGELILKESPAILGPPINAFLICFRCCSQINRVQNVCDSCKKAPVCSPRCKGPFHNERECEALRHTTVTTKNFVENPQIIMPVRCILLRAYNPDKWDDLMQMEAHLEHRKDTMLWRMYKINVEIVLCRLNFISAEDVAGNLVQKVCGVLDVNTFEVRPSHVGQVIMPVDCLRGIYLTPALMAHDCLSNTHLAVDDDFLMSIHASTAIPAGGIIFFNYTNGLQGSAERRKHLKEGKYFDCCCTRCSDYTEMGSDLSALFCPKCKVGFLYCSDPLKNAYKVPWICESCKASYKGNLIQTTINLCQDQVQDYSSIQEAEIALKKLKHTLVPRHYLMLEIKQTLIALLSSVNSTWAFERKISLCTELLSVLEILEPGISRLQGITKYELHNARVALTNKRYSRKEINSEQFLADLQQADVLLKDSIKSLLYEPKKSPEGRLTLRALGDLRNLRGSIEDVKRIIAINPAIEII